MRGTGFLAEADKFGGGGVQNWEKYGDVILEPLYRVFQEVSMAIAISIVCATKISLDV